MTKTVKDDKDQHFNNKQPKVGLQIFHNTTKTGLIYKTLTKLCCAYLNFQEMHKHNKIINMFKTDTSSNHFEKKSLESCFQSKQFYQIPL